MITALLCLLAVVSCRISRPLPRPLELPERVRSTVFRRLESGPGGGAKFLTVVVSSPQVPALAGSHVRLRVLVGRHPGPYLPAKAADQAVFDLLVRRAGRQLWYWPELVSIFENGLMPCQAAETLLLDLGDTLHTARSVWHQTCHTFLQTKLTARTPLLGTPDTLCRYQMGTVASSTHLPHVAGIEVDQQLQVRGILYQTTQGSVGRGFRDEQFTYRGEALLMPIHP